jgi:hypothetical protein
MKNNDRHRSRSGSNPFSPRLRRIASWVYLKGGELAMVFDAFTAN